MASLNKVLLIGNIGRDPETRYMPSGDAMVTFSLATSEKWKDKNTGEKQEATTWHNCVVFGRQAEIVGEYCGKGSPLYIEGRIQHREYEDREGETRRVTEIVVERFQMLGRASDNTAGRDQSRNEQDRGGAQANTRGANQGQEGARAEQGGRPEDLEDDIPF